MCSSTGYDIRHNNCSPSATISYAGTPFCKSVATAQSVTRTGTAGGTFSASPAGLTINAATGAITPSTSTAWYLYSEPIPLQHLVVVPPLQQQHL
jgi:hypothetical protein